VSAAMSTSGTYAVQFTGAGGIYDEDLTNGAG
jgi:hypothetical protein